MSHEKRFVLFLLLMLAWLYTFPYVFDFLGFKAPAKPQVAKDGVAKDAGAKDPAKGGPPEIKAAAPGAVEKGAKAPAETKDTAVKLVDDSELALGDATDKTPDGYRLRVQLDQKGAGVKSVLSSRFDAEFKDGNFRKKPLELLERDPLWPYSLAMTLSLGAGKAPSAAAATDPEPLIDPEALAKAEDSLDRETWDVVRDDQKRVVRPISKEDPATKAKLEGQEASFRTTAADGLVVTKTFRLWKKSEAFEVELAFESPGKPRTVVYNLLGPHGIPIEGDWYTSTFREVFFGQLGPNGVEVPTYTADQVAAKVIDNTALPLRFSGVENQYFATLMEPVPPPTGQEDRWDESAIALYHAPSDPKDQAATQKGDVAVKVRSRPIKLDAGQKAVHTYRVFAGTKTPEALAPFAAEGLASYRKSSWIPFAPYLARVFISPTLSFTYDVTRRVAGFFGGTKGNYGIAIILLTFLVRMLLFPLGRKQALSAQKMQDLQPYLKEIQEKYKDDKERLTKETFATYKKYGVNPFGGCLPALVQLPIFVGLWQALNTSVVLRHASFLWIRDLAAPDMLFQFPMGTEIPFLGRWFNVLPLLVVSLMLVQTKLFSPPPTTPEAEMNQKMMKYMMAFMAVMFYKVPAGLGIYFITSSLWSIGERLLLPKLAARRKKNIEFGDLDGDSGLPALSPKGGRGGPAPLPTPAKPPGRFAQFWEKVLEEARRDPTYRKVLDNTDPNRKDRDKGKETDRDKDRGRPRTRPGRR